eukprot:TRINITY_DN1164_c0_g1_i3.p1 TRINITY_DN1164_c0_g1~~TRINITY_DN1164_c0_g1_i3.p1  ORF type:complete len:740 (+),score=166.80 TRINITY_DN1164_c0_g1_i3:56-2275(+)
MVSSDAIALFSARGHGTEQRTSGSEGVASFPDGAALKHGTKRKAIDADAQAKKQPRTSWFGWLGFGGRSEDMNNETAATKSLDLEEIQRLISSARGLGLCEQKADAWLQKLDGGVLEVGILGLLKSGKTTLANCFIGHETLPSSSQPETACLVDVVHDAAYQDGKLLAPDGTLLQEGHPAIRGHIHELNEKHRLSVDECTSDDKGSSHVDRLEVRTRMAISQWCPGIEHIKLVDTPGPNETGAGLWHEVINVLLRVDAIIYVLDFTKISTTDEAVMFETLRKNVLMLLSSTSGDAQQMFFILNKVDMRSSRNDKTLEEILEYVAQKLNTMLPCKVTSEQVLPLVAEDALLARQVKSAGYRPTGELLKDFMRRNGHRFDTQGRVQVPTVRQCRSMAEIMEKQSLIHGVEKKVLCKVANKKTLLSATSVCQKLFRELQVLENSARARQVAAEAGSLELQKKISEMSNTVQDVEKRLGELPTHATALCTKVRRRAQDAFSSIAADILATADLLLQDENLQLQADSMDALASKANTVSCKLKQLVQLKWNHHRMLLMHNMRAEKQAVRADIVAMARPILEAMVVEAERVLETPLLLEDLVPEAVDFATFEAEVHDDIAAFARSETKAVQRRGLCTEEWTEVPVLMIDRADLQREWMGKLQGLVDASQARTVDLVHANVNREVQTIVNYISARCKVYVQTLKDEQNIRNHDTADASTRIAKAREQVQDIGLLKSRIQTVLSGSS